MPRSEGLRDGDRPNATTAPTFGDILSTIPLCPAAFGWNPRAVAVVSSATTAGPNDPGGGLDAANDGDAVQPIVRRTRIGHVH
jgi:hypothetical protein